MEIPDQRNGYLLEVCANSPTSALAAQAGGASRIELCQSLESGGITPSAAQIILSREALSIGIFVLIRPRSGNFVYSDLEFSEMLQDIQYCREKGCDGVVVGVLTEDGDVDVARMQQLMQAAGTMQVVFHRAFDLTRDPIQALEDIIALGCVRILTSGLAAQALAGKEMLRDLVARAADRIEIMPGAGVDPSNIGEILSFTGARSIHSSAKIVVPSTSRFKNSAIAGMDESQIYSSADQVADLVRILSELA